MQHVRDLAFFQTNVARVRLESSFARIHSHVGGATDFIPKDELPKLVSLLNGLFSASNADGKIPEIGVPVVVQCAGFSCLGYLDRTGKWRDFARSSELPAVIDWCEL